MGRLSPLKSKNNSCRTVISFSLFIRSITHVLWFSNYLDVLVAIVTYYGRQSRLKLEKYA